MLQPTNHLCGPSSDLLQQVNIFVVRTQHSTPGLQVQNRCLIAPIRLPCLTMNFKEVCSPMDPVFTGSVISCQGCCFLLLLFVFSLLVCIVVCLFCLGACYDICGTYVCIYNVQRYPVSRCSKLVLKIQSSKSIFEVQSQLGSKKRLECIKY